MGLSIRIGNIPASSTGFLGTGPAWCKSMTRFDISKTFRHLAILLAAFSMPARAFDFLPDFFGTKEPKGVYVFQAGQQYVKIVKREKGEGSNAQPVRLTPQQVRTVLEGIKVRKDTGLLSENNEQVPVFVESEISTLSAAISRGLEQAKADEDLIFVVIGMHEGILTKEQIGISGRVFYEDGKLNLIFGEFKSLSGVSEEKARNLAAGCGDCPVDERTNPFKIATRSDAGKMDDPIAITEGLEFKTYDNKLRPDWLVLDVNKMVAAAEKIKNKLPPALEKEQARAQAEAAKANLERRQMREELARMRKEIDQMRANGGSASGGESIEDRLATLDKMKKKGLITEEEYATRRKQLLDQI